MGTHEQWAEQAARLLAESEGALDCASAKRRAGLELGLFPGHDEPSCEEVEQQLRIYQQLFRPSQQAALRALRGEAVKAMRFLADFEPRLVGAVLSGTAGANSTITLHLFADAPEQVMLHLLNAHVPYREAERSLRYRDGRVQAYPLFSFIAGGYPVDLVVLPPMALRESPAGFGEGGKMDRAPLHKVERLLEASGADA
ncbi:MAG: hypothetical protein FNT29_00035 [Halothiobacillaceae bacterium]|nr:MAG: hypothetical protein FNT29_00035 [Halothiobacillaceae bacterium]